jgi:hypothetical protein
MTRWKEAGPDRRYRHPPGGLDALLGGSGSLAGATASGSPEHRDHLQGGTEPAADATAPIGTVDQDPWYRRARTTFRDWRRTRPFWAGVLCLLGGALMAYGPLSVFRYVLVAGTVIWAGVLIGLLVCAMGLFFWLAPQFRQLVGILAAVFSVVSLITSNFGGFIIGMLLGSFGGAMGFAWTPLQAPGPGAEKSSGTPAPGQQAASQPGQQSAHGAHADGPGAAAVDGRTLRLHLPRA